MSPDNENPNNASNGLLDALAIVGIYEDPDLDAEYLYAALNDLLTNKDYLVHVLAGLVSIMVNNMANYLHCSPERIKAVITENALKPE